MSLLAQPRLSNLWLSALLLIFLSDAFTLGRAGEARDQVSWKKCCFQNQYFNLKTLKCETVEDEDKLLTAPPVHRFSYNSSFYDFEQLRNVTTNFSDGDAALLEKRHCPGNLRYFKVNEIVHLLSNGNLLVDVGTSFQVFEGDFCLENFYSPDEKKRELFMSGFICKNATPNIQLNLTLEDFDHILRCEALDLRLLLSRMRLVYTICGFVSLFFLAVTVFFYSTLPELSNFQGYISCNYIVAVFLTTLLLTTSFNSRLESNFEDEDHEFFISLKPTACKILGHSIYFAAMQMFSWMSILSFDLYWSFGCNTGALREKKHFKR